VIVIPLVATVADERKQGHRDEKYPDGNPRGGVRGAH